MHCRLDSHDIYYLGNIVMSLFANLFISCTFIVSACGSSDSQLDDLQCVSNPLCFMSFRQKCLYSYVYLLETVVHVS